MPISRSRSLQTVLIVLLLIGATAGAYARVGHFGFIDFDDDQFVSANPHVKQGITPQTLRWVMGSVVVANWHPVTMFSHLLDVALFGVRAGPAHLVNLGLHIANALLLFALLEVLTRARWRSAIVAGLFALHPLHVESVAWISERKDVLSTFLFLLTLLAYVSYARGGRGERGRWRWYLAAMVLLALGLMSKPMLVTTPLVMLLLDFWPLKREQATRQLLLEKLPFAVLSIADGLITFSLQRQTGAVPSLSRVAPMLRAQNAIVSGVGYLADMIWPAKLAVFYPYPTRIPPALVLLCATILIALTWLAWRQRNRRPYLLMGWLWYGLTLLPVIGLVQVGDQARADRYTYIPSIGIFIAVAWTVRSCALSSLSRGACSALAVVVLALLGWGTWIQTGYWQNSRTLWTHAAQVTRGNWLAWNHLATLDAKDGQYAEALQLTREVVRVRPDFAGGYLNLGNVLMESGELRGAMESFRRAISLHPGLAAADNNLGRALLMTGQVDAAVEEFEAAVKADPDNPDWQRNLATALRYRHSATTSSNGSN
jgi:hypothetical protein